MHMTKEPIADSVKMVQMEKLKNAQIETQKAKLHEESIKRYSLSGGLVLLAILALISYRNFKRKKRDHHFIEIQNEILEEKNKEVMDSITYAKRIQSAILPSEQFMNEHLPHSFVLYRPKDIVAGDFYWVETLENKIIFAAADCTGHGVPGAMVSVVCFNVLNKAVRVEGLCEPAAILDRARELIMETFRSSEFSINDGMDIALCCIEKSKDSTQMKLEFAGANNPLWVIREIDGEMTLVEIKGDKQPVGNFFKTKPFVNHQLTINNKDAIYIFSDGFADQFGGERGKKYKAVRFKQKLLEVCKLPFEKQKAVLEKEFNEWKGAHEQLDDICVLGLRYENNLG